MKNLEENNYPGVQVDRFEESEVVGYPIANMNYAQTVDQIERWADRREKRYVCVCNVHSLTSSRWMPELKDALESSDMNIADGVPLVWMQRAVGYRSASRVYGPNLMLELMNRCNQKGLRVALYGGHTNRIYKLVSGLKADFKDLKVVKVISPPFRPLTKQEDDDFTKQLQDARPDVILVGIGCPKQEIWMKDHSPKIRGVMIGVGAAFDFHAGAVKQAPARIQSMGLEWAYRLYREPKRLFKRYISTNPVFIVLAAKQLMAKVLVRKKYVHSRMFFAGSN
ncbi:WecB/TagA/CpsF family glycosyltransferase [Puniceicoccaceae bacterium K14]|nr:WecB/TagA/CpsF family glycosyltransferase [Puniceicoccaceae bacterium K14]